MHKFALNKITESGNNVFYKLVIDGVCEFDDFIDSVKANYETEVIKIFWLANAIVQGHIFPEEKLKNITPRNENISEYEIKTKHLRAYFIKISNDRIILCAGFKSNNRQQKDINHFRNLKQRYLEGELDGNV